MPLTVSDEAFNTPRLLSLYTNICCIATGLMPQFLKYADLRRVLQTEGEEISAKGDDYLGEVLANHLRAICQPDGDDSVDPNASLAALADTGLARSYDARALLIWDLRDRAKLAGVVIACLWKVDATIATARFTPAYCQNKGLPDFSSYALVDVICSRRSPAALIGIMSLFKQASRQRARPIIGLCAVCINEAARARFAGLGFQEHAYREQGSQRWLVHMKTADLTMEKVSARLKFDGGEDALTRICTRNRLTAKTRDTIMTRCGM